MHIHLVGIGGAGLSAIATVLLEQGYTVSGSDMQESPALERLRRLGASISIGHRTGNLTSPDLVVISSAIPANNPEVLAAQQRGIPVQKRPAWLGRMMAGKRGVAIAGTHGKTTTTAMVSLVLSRANLSPTYIIGGHFPQLNGNAAAGQSDWFVIEADEYDHTFLSLKPELAVITNVEWDHPDIYPTEAAYRQAFIDFAALVPERGQVIVCGDDQGVQGILQQLPSVITYGMQATNTWQAVNLTINEAGGYSFDLHYRGQQANTQPLSLRVPGRHNVLNALAALIMAQSVGVSLAETAKTLSAFAGAGRRFELKGEVKGVTVIDDYAHHPTEVRVNIDAARTRFADRPLWAVFQPHTFSRTRLLLNEFAAALDGADHVIVLDIFPSREQDDGTISSADLIARMNHAHARHIGPIPEAVKYLHSHLKPGDVLMTMSAGDGYLVSEGVLAALRSHTQGG